MFECSMSRNICSNVRCPGIYVRMFDVQEYNLSAQQSLNVTSKTHQIETALAGIGLEKQLLLPLLYLYKTHIGTMTQQNSFFIEVQHFINILS